MHGARSVEIMNDKYVTVLIIQWIQSSSKCMIIFERWEYHLTKTVSKASLKLWVYFSSMNVYWSDHREVIGSWEWGPLVKLLINLLLSKFFPSWRTLITLSKYRGYLLNFRARKNKRPSNQGVFYNNPLANLGFHKTPQKEENDLCRSFCVGGGNFIFYF